MCRCRKTWQWFVISLCFISFFSWKNLERLGIQVLPLVYLAEALDAPTILEDESSSMPSARVHDFKFYIIAPPGVTSGLLVGNETERASKYYSKALNEESAEIWLHRGFEQQLNEARTMDPFEADVFLIAGYLHYNQKIQSVTGSSLTDAYRKLIVNASKPHLLLIPSWNPTISNKAGIKRLVTSLTKNGVNLWSVGFERNLMWQGLAPDRILPIPYIIKPSSNMIQEQQDQRQPLNTSNKRTSNFVFYAGDARKHAKEWAGCHRDRIILPLQNNTKNINLDVRLVGKQNRISQEDYNHRMSTSEYCLILCGDTPSSRSLTSAMVSGCIPVRVGSRLRGRCEPPCHGGWGWKPVPNIENAHLPFAEQIPWAAFPEINESQVMESGQQALQDLFEQYNDARKEDLRRTLQRVQNGWIYGWGDPVVSTDFGEAIFYIWKSFIAMLQSKRQL